MKNLYEKLKNKHQQEMNAFPIGACFSQKQFEEMMQKWGLTVHDTDKICSIGGGCYVRKSDYKEFIAMGKRFEKERKDAIVADKTGDGYIYQMFLYELANHEYCITYDYEDTFDALGLTVDEINADKRLLHGLKKATREYLKHCEDY